jgi:hypothetical protein
VSAKIKKHKCTSVKNQGAQKKSAKNRVARKKSTKNQGVRERERMNAKARNLRPKKERESASTKSFPQERESASAKPKKKRVPSYDHSIGLALRMSRWACF